MHIMTTETPTAAATTIDVPTPEDVGQVIGRLMEDVSATSGVLLTLLGQRLGLWQAMAKSGPSTAAELASTSGTAEPYIREWLRSQTAAGYVTYEPGAARFALPPAVAAVLATAPLSGLVAGTAVQARVWWAELERYEDAFRTGSGIGWSEHPAAHSEAMDLISRAVVVSPLAHEWLRAVHGLANTLESGAVVADVGCGYGAPTIAMAQAYPASRFTGFDSDDASIAHARKAAAEAGLADRVTFEVSPATEVRGGPFDLITFVDVLHDLGDPVGALTAARRALTDGGSVLLVEHAGSDRLEENLNPIGRFFYACSALVCTPNALSQSTAALGTMPGEGILRRVAADAGFSEVRRVPVEAPLNILLDLRR